MESYLVAEISASAVAHNLGLLRKQIKKHTRLCAVVKADCYGHSLDLLLPTIAAKADCLAVAAPLEAIHLRRLGYEGPILCFFTPCAFGKAGDLREALDEMVGHDITLTMTNASEIQPIAQAAKRVGKTAGVHLKIDTGMGRSGILAQHAGELAKVVSAQAGIVLTGMYSHLACADSADKASARQQIARFQSAANALPNRESMTLHLANSAGTIDLPEAHFDMVRPGIAIYGYQPSDDMNNALPLRPALRLTAPLMQVKDVAAGSSCGYGLTYTYPRDGRMGLVPIGYGDGYFRSLSNQAVMKVAGKFAPIRGRVSMDQIIIDLTDIPTAKVGQAVEIISDDPTAPNSVEGLARQAGTIPYEITCRLMGRRIKKVLVK
jgi:alanine racemase